MSDQDPKVVRGPQDDKALPVDMDKEQFVSGLAQYASEKLHALAVMVIVVESDEASPTGIRTSVGASLPGEHSLCHVAMDNFQHAIERMRKRMSQ
mgnify:CR=1 FL=1